MLVKPALTIAADDRIVYQTPDAPSWPWMFTTAEHEVSVVRSIPTGAPRALALVCAALLVVPAAAEARVISAAVSVLLPGSTQVASDPIRHSAPVPLSSPTSCPTCAGRT